MCPRQGQARPGNHPQFPLMTLQLVGETFGQLTVLAQADDYVSPKGQSKSRWVCKCACGNVTTIIGNNLRRGTAASCGCRTRQASRDRRTHGHKIGRYPTPTYKTWLGMKERCLNLNHPSYGYYGGRGVSICDRWVDSFEAFLADMGECPDDPSDWVGTHRYWSLDRINPDGDYTPQNCRWASPHQQTVNRRSNINS